MIACLIGRCNIFQNIYLHRKLLALKELEEALIRLHAMMILYLSNAKRFFEQTSVKRILKSVIVSQDEFAKISQSIIDEQQNVDRCAALVNAENRNNISNALQQASVLLINSIHYERQENLCKETSEPEDLDRRVRRLKSKLKSAAQHPRTSHPGADSRSPKQRTHGGLPCLSEKFFRIASMFPSSNLQTERP